MRRLVAALVALALGTVPALARAHDPVQPADLVDPMIGTMGAGFVFPGPAAPYGMVQLSPDTEGYFAYTGYQYIDRYIRGFSHVHVESMGVAEGGNVPFMPTTGEVDSTDVRDYQSPFSHATEVARAGSYRVLLAKYGIEAELTAGVRVGMHRYTFPAGARGNVLLDVGRQVAGSDLDPSNLQRTGGVNRARVERIGPRTVVGTANLDRAADDNYAVYFAARFDRDIDRFGTWAARGDAVAWGSESVEGVGAGAAVSFDPSDDRDVVVSVGISFVSEANALENLDDELEDGAVGFDALRARTVSSWNEALSTITVDGGTPAERTAFVTALYHAQHHPNVFNDVNGEYVGHDDLVHRIGDPGDPIPAGSTYYANFSMWDTYRAEMPLLALIAPDRYRDFMRSLAAIARWGGRFSRWSLMNRHADFMNGEPALQVVADGYCRGLVPDDVDAALYAEARRLALVDRRNPEYLTKGYTTEASATLEHALGDFALALVADARGETADRDALLAQSANWRNVFDAGDTGFVRPRNADGTWRTPYYPEMPDGFREGTGWQYTWLVPQDLRGLFDAIGQGRGGDATVDQRLDTFFATPLTGTVPAVWPEAQQKLTAYGIAYYGNQYAPSNEHDLQAPWIYPWLGEAWKTQMIQRGYQSLYRATPDGLPGNDDLGTMSAWFVWSALGFYPVTPGSPTYVIGSPLFTRARIATPDGGTFTLEAPGASTAARFVSGATLGGVPMSRAWFTHDAFADGGVLRLPMSPVPDTAWGSASADLPPAASTHDLSAFACDPG